jgi:DNA-binding transcriptional ArsR family regulator
MITDEYRTRRLLACLGDPSRFRVMARLAASEYCVTELAREIGLSQSCTTRHLQALEREGLVRGTRFGKRVVFSLRTEEPMIADLVGWAMSRPAEVIRAGVPNAAGTGTGDPVKKARNGKKAVGRRGREAPSPLIEGPPKVLPEGGTPGDRAAEANVLGPARRREEIEDFLL